MAFVVGLTGGIGSGKTTVGRIFSALGVPVYNSDLRARELTNSHPLIVAGYSALFGQGVYVEGSLDRARVAQLVFADKDLLKQAEAVVHPVVRDDFSQWLKLWSAPYVVKESALLFENGAAREMDVILTVTAPEDLRIARVMQREACDEAAVRQRMAHQWAEADKVAQSTYVVVADEQKLVIPQILKIHQTLLGLRFNK